MPGDGGLASPGSRVSGVPPRHSESGRAAAREVVIRPVRGDCSCPLRPIRVATVQQYVLVWYLSKCTREWTVV